MVERDYVLRSERDKVSRLAELADCIGYHLTWRGGMSGETNNRAQTIHMSSDLEPLLRVMVLAHELTHAIVGNGGNVGEVEADAVSYVVCRHLGSWYSRTTYGRIYSIPEDLASRPEVISIAQELVCGIEVTRATGQ